MSNMKTNSQNVVNVLKWSHVIRCSNWYIKESYLWMSLSCYFSGLISLFLGGGKNTHWTSLKTQLAHSEISSPSRRHEPGPTVNSTLPDLKPTVHLWVWHLNVWQLYKSKNPHLPFLPLSPRHSPIKSCLLHVCLPSSEDNVPDSGTRTQPRLVKKHKSFKSSAFRKHQLMSLNIKTPRGTIIGNPIV